MFQTHPVMAVFPRKCRECRWGNVIFQTCPECQLVWLRGLEPVWLSPSSWHMGLRGIQDKQLFWARESSEIGCLRALAPIRVWLGMPVLGMCLLGQVLGVAPCGSDGLVADRDPPLQVRGRCFSDCLCPAYNLAFVVHYGTGRYTFVITSTRTAIQKSLL